MEGWKGKQNTKYELREEGTDLVKRRIRLCEIRTRFQPALECMYVWMDGQKQINKENNVE